MKRLSSFGFVPVSSHSSAEKRAKNNHSSSPSEEPSPSGIEREPSAYSPPRVEVQPQEPLQPQVPQTQSKISPSLSRNDLGTYSTDELKSLSDEERLWLIRNTCRPDPSYKYPHKLEYGKKRSFQHT